MTELEQEPKEKSDEEKLLENKYVKATIDVIKKDLTWILVCLILVALYYRAIKDCNEYYQEKLLDTEFLEEQITWNFNNRHSIYRPGVSSEPKPLNSSITLYAYG